MSEVNVTPENLHKLAWEITGTVRMAICQLSCPYPRAKMAQAQKQVLAVLEDFVNGREDDGG